MSRIISFALGNIWSWENSKNIASLLKYTKDLDINGIEITLSDKEELYSFNLSHENENFLEKLEYISIHAPFKLISNSEEQGLLRLHVYLLNNLSRKVKSKNMIIHPNEIPFSLIKDYSFKVSSENMSNNTNYDLDSILEHPEIGLCLDVSHAYKISKEETSKLIERHRERITQVHFSSFKNGKNHQSVIDADNGFYESIERLKELTCPIVIEEDIKEKNLDNIKREISFVRKLVA